MFRFAIANTRIRYHRLEIVGEYIKELSVSQPF